jgi:hypothetical protein
MIKKKKKKKIDLSVELKYHRTPQTMPYSSKPLKERKYRQSYHRLGRRPDSRASLPFETWQTHMGMPHERMQGAACTTPGWTLPGSATVFLLGQRRRS